MKKTVATAVIALAFTGAAYGNHLEHRGFDVRYGFFRVASIAYAGHENAASYAAAARITTAGIVSAFIDVRFDFNAEGRLAPDRLLPLSYREDVDTGQRQSQVELACQNTLPLVRAMEPDAPLPWDLDPGDWRLEVFDGRRRPALVLGPATEETDEITCAGHYDRLAGFTPEEMDTRQSFPFTVRFARNGPEMWELVEAVALTIHGRVTIAKRA